MDTQRISLSESAYLSEEFTTGNTVTISMYDLSDGSEIALDSSSCTEIGATGVFRFALSNITTYPTSFTEIVYIMDNSVTTKSGKVILYDPDELTTGANQVTLTIQDDDTDPIEGVEVKVYNSAQTLLLGIKTTDSNGQVVFSLNDGSYKVRLYKSLVDFTVPEDLTVSGVTTDTYTGTLLTITSGAGAGECELSIFVSSQRPTVALSSLSGTAQIVSLPAEISGVYYPGLKISGTYSSTQKRIYWVLPRGATCNFRVPDLGIQAEKAIPDAASADYSTL